MSNLKLYKSHKLTYAEPMLHSEYVEFCTKQASSIRCSVVARGNTDVYHTVYDRGLEDGYHIVYDMGFEDEYHSWCPKGKFEAGNSLLEGVHTGKTLHNSTVSGARKNVKDIVVFGDGDTFKLICKASSKAERWMKSTKAMQIDGVGCLVQVTTQQGDNVSEALAFVPGVKIVTLLDNKENGRELVNMHLGE